MLKLVYWSIAAQVDGLISGVVTELSAMGRIGIKYLKFNIGLDPDMYATIALTVRIKLGVSALVIQNESLPL